MIESVFTPTRYYNLMGQQVTFREEGYYIATDGNTSRVIYKRGLTKKAYVPVHFVAFRICV